MEVDPSVARQARDRLSEKKTTMEPPSAPGSVVFVTGLVAAGLLLDAEVLRQDTVDILRPMQHPQHLNAIGQRLVEDEIVLEAGDGKVANLSQSGVFGIVADPQGGRRCEQANRCFRRVEEPQ